MNVVPKPVSFTWDSGNIEKNWVKHAVHHREAEEIFFNKPLLILSDTPHSNTEKRYFAYGITNNRRKLVIVFTIRKNSIRVISARDQNKKERKKYEEIAQT